MIRAYWWRGGPESGNFGDQLTPILCQRLSGRRVVHAPPHLADVFAIGSILEPWFWPRESWRSFQGMIWGAGRMFGQTPMELPLADVRAVRGRLTLSTIACRHKAAVVLGDPGLLCALLARRTVKKYKLGVVPHWSERDHPLVQHLVSTSSEISLVIICDPVQQVIDGLCECEHILSSSLHGLVAADALEIPNEWLWLNTAAEDRAGKPELKYRDYYSVFGMADKRYLVLNLADNLDTVLRRFGPYARPGMNNLQRDLLEAFPFRNC
jgi:hypothetical protein